MKTKDIAELLKSWPPTTQVGEIIDFLEKLAVLEEPEPEPYKFIPLPPPPYEIPPPVYPWSPIIYGKASNKIFMEPQ